MEGYWNAELYSPTYDESDRLDPHYWTRPSDLRVAELVNELQDVTAKIIKFPYNFHVWYQRSKILQSLGYPELSAIDAYKALLLVRAGPTLEIDFDGFTKSEHVDAIAHNKVQRVINTLKKQCSFSIAQIKDRIRSIEVGSKQLAARKEIERASAVGLTDLPTFLHHPNNVHNHISREHIRQSSVDNHRLAAHEYHIREQLIRSLRAAKAFSDAHNLAQETLADLAHYTDSVQDSLRELSNILQEKEMHANRLTAIDAQKHFYLVHGGVRARLYPWMDRNVTDRHYMIRRQLRSGIEGVSNGKCTIKRRSLGAIPSLIDTSGSLGVFAMQDIPKGTAILTDAWSIIKDNSETAVLLNKLQIGEAQAKEYSEVLLRHLKFIIPQASQKHPLATYESLKLTANYVGSKVQPFSLQGDVVCPINMLRLLGIDPWRNKDYDGWVVQTLRHRLSNNIAGIGASQYGGEASRLVLVPFMTHLNHSCDPNTGPRPGDGGDDRTVMVLEALKDIKVQEELNLSYIGEVTEMEVAERREALKLWLGGDCMCSRCVDEA